MNESDSVLIRGSHTIVYSTLEHLKFNVRLGLIFIYNILVKGIMIVNTSGLALCELNLSYIHDCSQ